LGTPVSEGTVATMTPAVVHAPYPLEQMRDVVNRQLCPVGFLDPREPRRTHEQCEAYNHHNVIV
jgi:hypothetical protein